MANYKVNILNVEDTDKFTQGFSYFWGEIQQFVGLGIYGKLAAQLLSRVINYKWQNVKISKHWSYPINGGILVKADGDVAINCYGEVGILFQKFNKIRNCDKSDQNNYKQQKFIKEHIANDLKMFWNFMTDKNKFDSITIEGVTDDGEQIKRFDAKVDYNEFRILYDVLRGCDLKKIKAKYGEADFKKIIGEKNDDQFVLAATESIINEISKLIKERELNQDRLKKEYEQMAIEIKNKYKDEKEASNNSYNKKIKKLEEQIKIMMLKTFS